MMRRVVAALLVALTVAAPAAAQEKPAAFPLFRHVDPGGAAVAKPGGQKIVLLTDADFAPWSFPAPGGATKGISVELALAACGEQQLECSVKTLPFDALVPALLRGEGDLIVSGLKLDQALADQVDMTRPYFISMGRFAVRSGSPVTTTNIRALAGRRIGYVKGTAHGTFIELHYPRSALIPYGTADAMLEALRTGGVDVAFGDAMMMGYWLQGSASRNCCMALDKPFIDRSSFTRNLVFLARKDPRNLRAVFDQALDKLEAKGRTGAIFTSYLPAPLW